MAAVLDTCTGVATTVVQDVVLKAWMQLRYLRKYKNYVKDFENEQGKLSATLASVNLHIDEAKKRNETLVDPRVEDWRERVNELLQQGTKPTKCFGLCANCFSKITRAKELDSLTKELIPKLIAEVHEFDAFARAARVPGMEYYSQEFMRFESRKANFDKLKEELEDENNYRIGLQGLGGTGKSTMAIEVGKHVEKSNPFDRVIFISVSTPVDEKGIRDDIAKQLELQLEEEKLLTHAQQIWIRIAHAGKVLIILDDVWEELNLNNIGIQHGIHNKGRCCVLLTTRSLDVCVSMRCQKTLQLDVLPKEDAFNLFLSHITTRADDCLDDLKKVGRDIVNECGGLPVMIVAVAKALKSWPPQRWQEALIVLKNPMPLRHGIVDEHKRKIYNSLRFSYDYLKDIDAQVVFLLCSIFPKAYEIPIELLSRITIGLGLFGEGDRYYITRSHVHEIKNKLLNSSLLLKAGEEYVKMHDVIREMALEKIDNEKIQVIMDSKTKLKKNVKYSSWIIDGFSNCFDESKLEILLIWINANEYSLKVPKTVFNGMKHLRVLLLHSKIEFGRTSALSLPKSIQSLQDIRTLSLINWELGNISGLIRNLQKLESLELTNCSIFELPNEICELNKLRFLCLIRCSLEEDNPFDVIARCSQLEELYYVSNDVHNIPIGAKVHRITSLPKYQIYHIDGSDFSTFDSFQLDTSIKRSFKPAKLQRIFSKEIIKSLAARAEVLKLEGDNETGWNNLIPSMISIEDGAMEDLINLSLISWSEMKYLIHTEHLQLKYGVTIFSKLAELQLDAVSVREICCGYYPDGFLKNLQKLELKRCRKLENTLFKGRLDLGNLKSIEIVDCSMACFFHPSTAQSLRQLETLRIAECSKLKYIIKDEKSSIEERVDDDPNPTSNDSVFPKLKLLSVKYCGGLEFILPICFCKDLPLLESVEIFECDNLRYMFGQYPKERRVHQMQKGTTLPSLKVMSIKNVPLFVNLYPECSLPQKSPTNTSEGSKEQDRSASHNVSWDPLCCFLPKSVTTNKNGPSTSKIEQPNHIASQEKYIGDITNGVFTPPLYPRNLRKMNIEDISNFRSLFSVAIASSMSLLEELVVSDCDELVHIVIGEVDSHDHMNANSIFPNLRTIEIKECDNLEYVFPASCSRNLVHLESVLISGASQLKYVFGKSCGEDNSPNQNHNIEIDLSALNKLCLKEVSNIVSMCPENYYVKALSLQDINLDGCPQLPINSFIDLSVEVHKGQEQLSRKKVMGMQLCNLKHLTLESLKMETMYDLKRLQITSLVDSSLESLWLGDLNMLRNICVGPKHLHLSFQNLSKLVISRCHQMKFILSAPISRNLPYLRHLWVLQCKELECIIEDGDEECYFPNLHFIYVEDCESLKCLFSISTCGSLPQLSALYIGSAPELEQVFERKQDTTQELDIKHVFPILFLVTLIDLPKLHTICSAIDFQTVMCRVVGNCPNLSLTSIDTEFLESYWDWLEKSERNKGYMDELDLFEQIVSRVREIAEKTVKRDPPTAEQDSGSSSIKEIEEASDEESSESEADEGKDSERTNKPAPFVASSLIESPQETMEPTSQEGSKLDEVALTTNKIMEPESSKSSPTAFVVPSEDECPHDNLVGIEGKGKRITLDHQVLPKTEHDMHPHDSQKDIEACVGERSDKMAMGSPSTTTEKSPPLIPSISISKKPQIASSSTDETELKSSQSDLLDTQDETKVTQAETCMPCVSEQLENDDLMILFKIIEEGADMEIHMPYESKIPAHEYDSEVTKALADLESSLKMDLNEIASSKESRLCLENALNTLSSHCSDDGLKATIHSLQQEIEIVLSSFKQAYTTSDTVTKLEQKEKLMIGQSSHRKGAAMTLLSEIHKTQTRKAELKEQISKLQAELHSKGKEIKECEVKLLSLEEQKKKSVSDTIGFIKELEVVKKERSQLENVNSKWSSCLANLKKTSLLLGVHLKQKL